MTLKYLFHQLKYHVSPNVTKKIHLSKLECDSNKAYKFDELDSIYEKAVQHAYGNNDFQDYKHCGILHYSENCSGCGSFWKCYYSCTCIDSDDLNSDYLLIQIIY